MLDSGKLCFRKYLFALDTWVSYLGLLLQANVWEVEHLLIKMLRNLFLINERSTALYLKLLMVFSMNITSQCRVYFLFFRNMNVLHVAVVVITCCIAVLCNKLICVVESENVNICSAFMHCVIGFTCVVYGMPKFMHLRLTCVLCGCF